MRHLKQFGLLMVMFWSGLLSAQQDTAFLLREVVIVDRQMEELSEKPEKPMNLPVIAQALSEEPSVYLRTYAPGLLQTIALRGNAPHQVAVLWNGINLQNSMNGVYDASLLPMSVDDIRLSDDQAMLTVNNGSNRAVELRASWDQQTPFLTVDIGYNSLQNGHWRVALSPAFKGYTSRYYTEEQSGQNKYYFPDRTQPGRPDRLLENGAYNIRHIGTDQYIRLAEHCDIDVHALYTVADRNIPPSLTEGQNFSNQQDSSIKLTARYQFHNEKWSWSAQSAVLRDAIQFDTFYHRTTSLINRLEGGVKLDKGYGFRLAVVQDLQSVQSLSLTDEVDRQLLDINAIISKNWSDQHVLNLTLKQGFLTGRSLPVQGLLDYQFQAHAMDARLRVGRVLQVPTLNDLYWAGAGNPDLLEEVSYLIQGKTNVDYNWLGLSWSSHLDAEYKWIDNYILWVPQANGQWSPSNVKAVEVVSIVAHQEVSTEIAQHKLRLSGEIHYLSAKNKVVYHQAQIHNIGRQLVYMPEWKGFLHGKWERGEWSADIRYGYVSRRFQTADNRLSLPAYHLWDVGLGKTFQWNDHRLHLRLDVINIFDIYYEQIAFRPMPGRWLQGRIIYNFK